MIYTLKGKLILKRRSYIILENQGIGYRIFLLSKVLKRVKKKEDLSLFIFHYTKENEQRLYGFLSLEEREVFEALNSISGIGPKKALEILNRVGWKIVYQASLKQDPQILEEAGLTSLMAERVVSGLKRRVSQLEIVFKPERAKLSHRQDDREVVEVLKNLGYKASEVRGVLKKIKQDFKIEDKVKECLKLLS